jgi:hypothetical protein
MKLLLVRSSKPIAFTSRVLHEKAWKGHDMAHDDRTHVAFKPWVHDGSKVKGNPCLLI